MKTHFILQENKFVTLSSKGFTSIFLSSHATSAAATAVPPVFLIVWLKKGMSYSSDDEDSGLLE
jgi:hypothetical protein